MRWGARWFRVALLALASCLGARSSPCGDGRVCAPGTTCIAGLDLCATPDQIAVCANVADGSRCTADTVVVGTCSQGACISSGCGNGIVEAELGEVCDDGNTVAGDGCSADCTSDETCGNNVTDIGEQCDCGVAAHVNPSCTGPNSDSAGTCNTHCQFRCGDGIVEPDEGCDPGAGSTVVSCAGATYDRGLTTCSPSCQPVITPDTCKYIGWRKRGTQTPIPSSLAPVSAGSGFYTNTMGVGTYADYIAATPFVTTALLSQVWAADLHTAVAVGAGGTILRLNGTTWDSQSSGTVDLVGVWGRSSDDIYAIGVDTILHWNGASWSSLSPPAGAYHRIAGDVAHVYAVGDHGLFASYDGTAWTTVNVGTTENLHGVWSTGTFIVAVGANGTVVQNDGSGWTAGRTSTTANLTSTWGSATDGFFAVGEEGTVLFYDGREWRPEALGRGFTGPPNQTFLQVGGIEGVEIGLLGTIDVATYDGAAWSPAAIPTADTIYGLWASAPDDAFAVGRNGTILHHDGITWTKQPSSTTVDLRSVSGTASNDVYAAGDGSTLLHYDGSTWTRIVAADGIEDYTSVFALPGVVYLAGVTKVYGYATGGMINVDNKNRTVVWGASPTAVFAAGNGIDRFDGFGWSNTQPPTGMATLALGGTAANDVYAVGPLPYHYDGSTWSQGPFEDTDLTCVGASNLGVFAAGHAGKLRHWDGIAIEPMISRTTTDLEAVFVIGNLIFMAGADGTLETMVFHK
jgi:cysteine-rich repeat protein